MFETLDIASSARRGWKFGITAVAAAACLALVQGAFAQSTPGQTEKSAKASKTPFSQSQLSEVTQRMDLAKQIVARLAPEAASMGLSAGWRQSTMDILLTKPSSQLMKIASVGGYAATINAATRATLQTKALGDTTQDLVYKPFTPCRYIDTRFVGGKINGTRGFDLSLNGATYGGAAGCAPTTLAGVGENSFGAIAMNIAIVDTSAGAPGFVNVVPTGAASTTALVNWSVASVNTQDSNQAIVTMDQSGALNEFDVVTSGAVHVIIDLFGAFISPNATALDCVSLEATGTGTFTNGTVFFVDAPACTAGYALTGVGCSYNGTAPNGLDLSEVQLATSTFLLGCLWRNNSGTSPSATVLTSQVRCCRVPGH